MLGDASGDTSRHACEGASREALGESSTRLLGRLLGSLRVPLGVP